MKLILDQFILKTNKLDKILIILIFFFPLLMSITIFGADLFASLVAIITLFLIISKKEISVFYEIKKQIYFFLIFYLIVILSLTFSISFNNSFLPSFFYMRYFLFILGIFYILKKYDFADKIFFYSIIFTFIVVISDSIFSYFFLENIFGFKVIYDGQMHIITSFFNEEKKLGSYLVRLLPLLLSLTYYFKIKKINYLSFMMVGIIIFFTSERTAMFLYIVLTFFYFLIIKKKIHFILIGTLFLIVIFGSGKEYRYKYFAYTKMQLGLTETHWNSQYGNIIRYYSKEHEDLSYTALKIFKNNIFLGSGVKTFYQACNDLERISKKNAGSKEIIMLNDISFFNRNNKIKCSNHPHNFYFQLLSDTGIFSFIFVLLFFGHVLIKNIKILFKKNLNNLDMCFYFLNTGIILNILPLVPSGNFYNNWMALIMFFPLGFWLFINQKIKKNE